MAIAPTCFKMPYKDRSHLTIPELGSSSRSIYYSMILSFDNPPSRSRRGKLDASSFFCQAVKKEEGQIRALEEESSYFDKLQDDQLSVVDTSSSSTGDQLEAEILPENNKNNNQFESESSLDSLEAYLQKVKGDMNSENYVWPGTREMVTRGKPMSNPVSIKGDSGKFAVKPHKRSELYDNVPKTSQAQQQFDETPDLYLINIIAALNIAVFLFEIATPIKNSELELFSIPFLYGAKANQLIVIGEWWRLITPMFLHSGLLHVALGCWALGSFGPKVCKAYGSFTFLLIYLLGGISGNLTSFLHTPELTVGGTGPTFAMIGAWLIYQIQNKDMISKDVAESLYRKAVITTALSFLLSINGSIDDWTHFGAAITGITYGFFTYPILQMDDAASSSNKEEGITLVRRYTADPCKSVIVFTVFILVLGSLLLFIEPPLNSLVSDTFV